MNKTKVRKRNPNSVVDTHTWKVSDAKVNFYTV